MSSSVESSLCPQSLSLPIADSISLSIRSVSRSPLTFSGCRFIASILTHSQSERGKRISLPDRINTQSRRQNQSYFGSCLWLMGCASPGAKKTGLCFSSEKGQMVKCSPVSLSDDGREEGLKEQAINVCLFSGRQRICCPDSRAQMHHRIQRRDRQSLHSPDCECLSETSQHKHSHSID